MKTKISLVVFLTLLALWLPQAACADLAEAVAYLKSQTSDAWITQALVAAGETEAPVGHLINVNIEGSFNPANDYAKTILALAAAGQNPTTFGEIDYVTKLKSYYDGRQMGDATLLNDDIWSILALASVKKIDSAEAAAAKNFLLANQNVDGGWGYAVGSASDSNDTAAAIMALVEAGVAMDDAVITKAVAFLQTLQNDDGGFINDPAWGTASDSGSDAWVICAIYKLGQQPTSWIKSGNNPLSHLQSLQDGADGGFWWVDPASNPIFNNKAMTAFAVTALAGKSFPVGYYEIPPLTRLSVNKEVLNLGESLLVTVEYFNDSTWLPLAGAAIQGLADNLTTNEAGQTSIVLSSGEYNLSAVKPGFIASESVKISVLTPAPAPATGGSVIQIAPSCCQSVEYDVWQDGCVDGWQYRNVLTIMPIGCALTAEQENQRKRSCLAPGAEAATSSLSVANQVIGEESQTSAEVQPEVLGARVVNPSLASSDKMAAEAKDIVSGQVRDFVAVGTASTIKLGAGERAGVLNSYRSSFSKAPQTQTEWEDIIRISNNQLPLANSSLAEARAGREFEKVYGRAAGLGSSNDRVAINMMAYGLRPLKRDLNLERAGIGVFVKIYNYLPVSALDWDTVRAIAYSEVSR
jgi:hypothetical protein